MSIRYPNADYPESYVGDDMVRATDVPVNVAALNLTVTTAGAGEGPLKDKFLTGTDVPGVTLHGNQPTKAEIDPEPEAPETSEPFVPSSIESADL